jgi:two-component system, OmpR family, sensor histidine kinase VicK
LTISTADVNKTGRIEVLHNTEIITSRYLQIFYDATSRWDYFADIKSISIVPFGIESITKAASDAKGRGVKLRFVTEITKDNLHRCKHAMKIAELRHLDGVRGNFGISDSEYIAATIATPSESNLTTIPHAIYSNVKEHIQQQQYVFEILWNKAIPAEQKIREIEEGYVIERTEVVYGSENVICTELRFFSEAKSRIDTCMDYTRPPLAIEIESIRKSFVEVKSKAVKLRYLTEITNDNLASCKEIVKMVDELRHLDGIKGNFMISEREYLAPTTSHEKGQPAPIIIFSNIKELVEHQQYVFDSFWNRGIPAELRIREIEEGAERTNIEVIPNSDRARKIYLHLVNTAENEIMLMFPTTNAFIRQEKIGAIEICKESIKERNIKVRILMPAHKSTEQIVQNLREQQSNIDVRYIEQTSGTQATFLAIDRKASLVMEIRDDSKTTFDEAIGLSTYSNSRAGVLSYIAIFENLWKQTELYEDIKKAHEQLKIHDKMQHEFINVAAHELRTPIQPIIGLTEMLRSQIKDIKQLELLEVTIRNAKRLMQLTNDILDVTKIEGKSLDLKKEEFNLNDVVINAMNDITLGREFLNNENIRLSYNPQDILIHADKGRITQVISNLLGNAVKFIKKGGRGGTVIVDIEKKRVRRTGQENKEHEVVIVSIKDDGPGIDPEIMPRLFTKFAAKSDIGTGLGLFISKSIVEAHGGKIWAENNADGRGATFTFSLPITAAY